MLTTDPLSTLKNCLKKLRWMPVKKGLGARLENHLYLRKGLQC